MRELPELFTKRLGALLAPEHFNAAMDSFSRERPVFVRRNSDRINDVQIQDTLDRYGISWRPVEWAAGIFQLEQSIDLRRLQETDLFKTGCLYAQGLSSYLVPLLLDLEPGQTVLDMCAAPGSKSTQMALMLGGRGALHLNEKVRDRFFRLKSNMDLQGYENLNLSMKPGAWFGRGMPSFFDRILLDAPCSSEGRFHLSKPDSFKYWKLMKIRECQKKQKKLLRAAVYALKPGGLLVYSTCTFAPEENEAVVDWALRTMPDEIELLPVELPVHNVMPGMTSWQEKAFNPQVQLCRRIIPDEQMDAFFIAKFRRKQAGGKSVSA